MKLALLIHGGVDRSGSERVIPAVLWLIERLAQRHEVHVFSFNQEPEPAEWTLLGARVHNVGNSRGWRRRLFAAIAKEQRESRFDVIHAIFAWGGTYGAMLGWRHGIPMLFHAAGGELVAQHDIGFGMRRTLRGKAEVAIALTGARRMTVATQFMQQLANDLGVDANVVPLGVAIDRWPPAPPRLRDTSRPARLLHVGDINPVKDHATLLVAAIQLRDSGVSFELDLVGHDTMHGALQASDNAQRLALQCRWHGVLDRMALRNLMLRADVLLVSSRHEAGPLVVLEAAVVGVPTVGTHVGHVADWAPHAAAVSVPVGDASALANAVAALLADEPRRMSIAHDAQRRALAIDADVTASEFERIYAQMQSPQSRSKASQ